MKFTVKHALSWQNTYLSQTRLKIYTWKPLHLGFGIIPLADLELESRWIYTGVGSISSKYFSSISHLNCVETFPNFIIPVFIMVNQRSSGNTKVYNMWVNQGSSFSYPIHYKLTGSYYLPLETGDGYHSPLTLLLCLVWIIISHHVRNN